MQQLILFKELRYRVDFFCLLSLKKKLSIITYFRYNKTLSHIHIKNNTIEAYNLKKMPFTASIMFID